MLHFLITDASYGWSKGMKVWKNLKKKISGKMGIFWRKIRFTYILLNTILISNFRFNKYRIS